MQLETLDPGWRWAAYVRLGEPAVQIQGVVYMYTGQVAKGSDSGNPSTPWATVVGERRQTGPGKRTVDGLVRQSALPPTPRVKLPYREWFIYRPLPVITGENSQDPELLGVDEYVKKGLIRHPPEQTPDGQPTLPRESKAALAQNSATPGQAAKFRHAPTEPDPSNH